MKSLLLAVSLVALSSCASMQVIRGSSSDFLKRKATTLSLNATPTAVTPLLDQLFMQRGFSAIGGQSAEKGGTVYLYRGPRALPPEVAAQGIALGSWFAARVTPVGQGTEVVLLGKPMIGQLEVCSDADELLKDIGYRCVDSKVPAEWPATNYVSGRDETEVVSWVLSALYERLKN